VLEQREIAMGPGRLERSLLCPCGRMTGMQDGFDLRELRVVEQVHSSARGEREVMPRARPVLSMRRLQRAVLFRRQASLLQIVKDRTHGADQRGEPPAVLESCYGSPFEDRLEELVLSLNPTPPRVIFPYLIQFEGFIDVGLRNHPQRRDDLSPSIIERCDAVARRHARSLPGNSAHDVRGFRSWKDVATRDRGKTTQAKNQDQALPHR